MPALLPGLLTSSPGDDWVVGFENIQAGVRDGQTSHGTHARASGSMAGVGTELVSIRSAGAGRGRRCWARAARAIVGHWTYEGADRRQKRVTDVAVKSGAAGWLGRFSIFSGFDFSRMARTDLGI
jgi:hypothetical protein